MEVKTRYQSPILCLHWHNLRTVVLWLSPPPSQMLGFWAAMSAERGTGAPPQPALGSRGPSLAALSQRLSAARPSISRPLSGPRAEQMAGEAAAAAAAVIAP